MTLDAAVDQEALTTFVMVIQFPKSAVSCKVKPKVNFRKVMFGGRVDGMVNWQMPIFYCPSEKHPCLM